MLVWAVVQRIIPSEIEYQGEKIKLTKFYLDYDSYKNDPKNIHSSEIARVEKLVREAPIAPSYPTREQMIRAVFELKFPGYGLASSGERTLSDGSVIAGFSIEIPRAGKDRYLVFKGHNDEYVLIDDFVEATGYLLLRIQEQDEKLIFGKLPDKEVFERSFRIDDKH